MFDRTTYKSETVVTPVTRVVEKTITPNKVTEMYDKVREQAEKDILASVRVEENQLNGVAMQVEDSLSDQTSRVLLRFTLNGKVYENMETFATRNPMSTDELYKKLEDYFQRTVANHLFRTTLDTLPKGLKI